MAWSSEQILLVVLLAVVLVLLVWERWRYDLVAFTALMAAVVLGLVPTNEAFAGFGHPAVVVVALVLVVSRGLANSGAVELLARFLVAKGRSLAAHVGLLASVAAALSAFMNNVAALALLMPLDLKAATAARRSPAHTLMPLSFASILGGMVTLIGTPPNIVVAEYRADALGAPYRMFDFTPVGLAVTLVGVAYVALVGWRLIPVGRGKRDSPKELLELHGYLAEIAVPAKSKCVGRKVGALDPIAEEHDAEIVGLVRLGERLPARARGVEIAAKDLLVLQGTAQGIEGLAGALELDAAGETGARGEEIGGEDASLVEAVVPRGARIEGRSARSLHLSSRRGAALLGVSRQGKRFSERVRHLTIEAGDILLLLGDAEKLDDVISWLGVLPLAPRGLTVVRRSKLGIALGAFALAVVLAALGVLDLPIALGLVVGVMVGSGVLPLRQVYESVEWSVLVMLGSMIPLGAALERTGLAEWIANALVGLAAGWPPALVLVVMMALTMTLSDVMNNVATAVIVAPIALGTANGMGVNPDTFLMGVAVASSCAFLTPIGHKNNTLILGPGGYRFGDYWRMGLPLEILVLAVGVPVLLWVWPL
jgi:di/tricarboxylate transporter